MKLEDYHELLRKPQVARNNPHLCPLPCAESEPIVRHDALAAAQGETQGAPRVAVRIQSYRTRYLDVDNLTGGTKFLLDGLRYAGAIPGDRPQDIELTVEQFKVKRIKDERTEIILTPIT